MSLGMTLALFLAEDEELRSGEGWSVTSVLSSKLSVMGLMT